MPQNAKIITAAILVIGDEILSGRTKDKNIGFIADYLFDLGIDMREVRIVADDMDDIVAALNALRHRYTYVFTTGGIGPTHDDITADAVAQAFGVQLYEDPRIIDILLQRLKPEEVNEARRRMARIPHGGTLIENKVSRVPGFRIGNVIVMAGVPSIMQSMLEAAAADLETGVRMQVVNIEAYPIPEGAYGKALGDIAADYPAVSIGSYPSMVDGTFRNQIVVRSKDAEALAQAQAAVEAMLKDLRAQHQSQNQ
jgi:molybdenum cofactor synthesis domain-containing protein